MLDSTDLLNGNRWLDARPEASHNVADVIVVAQLDHRRRVSLPRHPQLNFRIRILKPVWQDTNYGV